METNEAPERIYVHVKKDKVTDTWNSTWKGVRDIEYTRTDAFIEKAERYIRSVADGLDRDNDVEAFINEFKKYMKK